MTRREFLAEFILLLPRQSVILRHASRRHEFIITAFRPSLTYSQPNSSRAVVTPIAYPPREGIRSDHLIAASQVVDFSGVPPSKSIVI